jgi:hypothetical protein
MGRRVRPLSRPAVARVFRAYPAPIRRRLLRLRGLIFDTAASLGVGRVEETLRWGERVPVRELAICISTALTYHQKSARRRARTPPA